ncbi:MAG: hypothetical protein R3E32_21405 [Chitinophagales bacterium]
MTPLEKLEKAYQFDTTFAKYQSIIEPEQVNKLNLCRDELHKTMNQWIFDSFNSLEIEGRCDELVEQTKKMLVYSRHLLTHSRFNNPNLHQKMENLMQEIEEQKKKFGRLKLYLYNKHVELEERLDSIESILQTTPCCNREDILKIRDEIILQDCLYYLSKTSRMNCSEIAHKQQEYENLFTLYTLKLEAQEKLSQYIVNWSEKLNQRIQTSIEENEIILKQSMKHEACCKIAKEYGLIPNGSIGCTFICMQTTPEELKISMNSDDHHELIHYEQSFLFDKPFSDNDCRVNVKATLIINHQTCDVETKIEVMKPQKI